MYENVRLHRKSCPVLSSSITEIYSIMCQLPHPTNMYAWVMHTSSPETFYVKRMAWCRLNPDIWWSSAGTAAEHPTSSQLCPRIFLAEKPSETFPSIFPKSCISEPRNVCITGNTGRDLAKLTKLAPNLKGSLFGTKTTITSSVENITSKMDRLPATSGTPASLKTIGVLVSNTALRPAMEATETRKWIWALCTPFFSEDNN